MARNDLTSERLKELVVYDPLTGVMCWRIQRTRWPAGRSLGTTCDKHGYGMAVVDTHRYPVHRLVWLYEKGVWPKGVVDHRDGVITNNRFDNLRDLTIAENVRNEHGLRANNSSGYPGVMRVGNRWRAKIKVNYKAIHLGYFDTPEEALAAREAGKRKYHPTYTL